MDGRPVDLARAQREAKARARALVEAATSGRRDRAEALLALDPGLARGPLDAALVLGDAGRFALRPWPRDRSFYLPLPNG